MSTGQTVGIAGASAFAVVFIVLMERARTQAQWWAFMAYGVLTCLAATVALLGLAQAAGVTPTDLQATLDQLLPFFKKR